MKCYITILFLFFLNSCYNLNDDIQDIKDELLYHKEMIEALQNNIKIIGIDYYEDRYVIKFSDGKSYTLYNGKTPIITIGENGNWVIDGIDTGKTSVGNDGYTPSVEISTDGFWIINGVNTGILAKGENGINAPFISNVLVKDNTIIFYFSDGSFLSTDLKKIVITVWGDSITWGSAASSNDKCYTAILRQLLNNHEDCFEVINCGVGGESFQSILVRQGALGFYLADDITIPSSPFDKVEIQRNVNWINNRKFRNTWFGEESYFSLLLQGELGRDNQEDKYKTVNPIIVNGIECTMSIEGTQNNCILYLSSNKELNSSVIVKSGTFLYPHGITFDSDITIFSIGTNGGFTVLDSEGNIDIDSSIEQYIDLVDLAIEKSGTSKYIICSPYGGYALRQLGVEGLYKLETALTKRYGNRHFNWRKYLIEYGLLEAGLEPTVKDLDAISKGEVPPTLLADGLHPNDAGHMVIGTYLYKMLYSLGYI